MSVGLRGLKGPKMWPKAPDVAIGHKPSAGARKKPVERAEILVIYKKFCSYRCEKLISSQKIGCRKKKYLQFLKS